MNMKKIHLLILIAYLYVDDLQTVSEAIFDRMGKTFFESQFTKNIPFTKNIYEILNPFT